MKRKILLVDDDRSVRDSLTQVLTTEDYEVLPAMNGEEALRISTVTRIDLVLLDLNMPIKNGWDTFERLSSDNPTLPIIVITARANQLFTALAAGVGALLEKPFEIPKLLATIRELLAEPLKTRLARLAGKQSKFHYFPSCTPMNVKPKQAMP